MKKITFFTIDIYPGGGTERVLITLANELSKYYSVEIISYLKTAEKPFYDINSNIRIINLNGKMYTPLTYYYKFISFIIKRKLKNYKTDVFICAGMRYVPMTIFFKKRAKFIAWEHYTSFIYKKWTITDIGRRIAAKKADSIIVLTQKDRENNIKLYKTDPKKIYNIYNLNGIKTSETDYNIASKCIITAGRLETVKGFDYLIKVASAVLKKHTDWSWHIYGDGSLRDELLRNVSEMNLSNRLIIKGFEKNLYDKYKDYSFYVCTSRYEGLGMTILEALNSKLPVISFDCPCGPGEIIQNNINGYLISCFDVDDMINKINFLIENDEYRKQLSDKALIDKDKFDNASLLKSWKDILA